MIINRQDTERFLTALDPSSSGAFTFQTFDDNKERSDEYRNRPENKRGSGDPAYTRVLHGTLAEHFDELRLMNDRGAGVFVTVNRTDLLGRSNKNIVGVRAFFVDLDGAPINPVTHDIIQTPHIICESSPEKWHAYWLLLEGMGQKLFKTGQKLLAARYGGDIKVNDLPRVMRLPGFIHRKEKPFVSRIMFFNEYARYDGEKFLESITPAKKEKEKKAKKSPADDSAWKRLNDDALRNLSVWVPEIFPDAISDGEKYRVTSQMLGRALQEDLSLSPEGIVDFGVADQGDEREGRRTAIDIVMEYKGQGGLTFDEAVEWLRIALGGDDCIIMRDGAREEILDKAQDAMIARGLPIYQRGGELVMPDKREIKESIIRRDRDTTIIFHINPNYMIELMAQAIKWMKFSKKGELKKADPDLKYSLALLARPPGKWKFPELLGIISTPTLDRDGNIVQNPGYNPEMKVLLDFPVGMFARIPENPSKEDAIAALKRLNHPLRDFPFDGEEDGVKVSASRSVALSAMLSILIRPSLRTVPMHGFDAPAAGTGKSILAEAPALLVSGLKPASMSQGKSQEEDEKRLSTVLHYGDTVILIDNCERQVAGDFLCSMLTQETVQARILGQSERRSLPCNALVVCTGNNLTFSGDVTRRSIRCILDARTERPDQRSFDFNFTDEVLRDRAELVVAALTVLRAYVVAGRPVTLKPMGSFDDWSWVRESLVWLGHKDPIETREAILASDPRKSELRDVLNLWFKAFGDLPVSVAQIGMLNGGSEEKSNLRVLLTEVSGKPFFNARSIGWWLRKNSKKIVGGRCLTQVGEGGDGIMWKIVLVEQAVTQPDAHQNR